MANHVQGIQGIQSQSSQAVQSTQASQLFNTQELSDRSNVQSKQERQEERAQGAMSLDEMRSAVSDLNSQLESQSIQVNFDVDDDTGRIVVKVKDTNSGEIVRQIPSEDMLDFARNAEKGIGIRLNQTL